MYTLTKVILQIPKNNLTLFKLLYETSLPKLCDVTLVISAYSKTRCVKIFIL